MRAGKRPRCTGRITDAFPAPGPRNGRDSAHRYSGEHAGMADMAGHQGWRDEEMAFCAPRSEGSRGSCRTTCAPYAQTQCSSAFANELGPR